MREQVREALLRDFFSAYFHEDWPCEAESPDAVIGRYAQNAEPSHVRALGEAIRNYARDFASDEDLEVKLFTELGCYYQPSAEGLSAKGWLERLAKQLLREG